MEHVPTPWYCSQGSFSSWTEKDKWSRRSNLEIVHTNMDSAPKSDQTIRNILHKAGLRSKRPAICSRLTLAHGRARRLFRQHHQNWTRELWSNVMFFDESRFSLFHTDGRVRLWRRPGERYSESAVQEVPFWRKVYYYMGRHNFDWEHGTHGNY